MNEKNGFTGAGILMAFVGGAIAGGIAAVLLTPQSGAETREDIRKLASDGADKMSRVPGAIKEAYTQGAELAKDAFSEAYKNGDKTTSKHLT